MTRDTTVAAHTSEMKENGKIRLSISLFCAKPRCHTLTHKVSTFHSTSLYFLFYFSAQFVPWLSVSVIVAVVVLSVVWPVVIVTQESCHSTCSMTCTRRNYFISKSFVCTYEHASSSPLLEFLKISRWQCMSMAQTQTKRRQRRRQEYSK